MYTSTCMYKKEWAVQYVVYPYIQCTCSLCVILCCQVNTTCLHCNDHHNELITVHLYCTNLYCHLHVQMKTKCMYLDIIYMRTDMYLHVHVLVFTYEKKKEFFLYTNRVYMYI